jgi:hypothetical protein
MMSDAQIFETVFNLFGWLYQISLPAPMRAAIEQQVASGWHNQDPSEQQFLSFLLDLNNKLSQSGDPEMYRANVLQHFRNEFAGAEQTSPYQLDDKGRLLLVIHRAVESTRPGCTGVPSAGAAGMAPGGFAQPSYAAPQPQSNYGNDPDRQLRDMEAEQQRLQREALRTAAQTNIEKMRYEMLKAVIQNIKY